MLRGLLTPRDLEYVEVGCILDYTSSQSGAGTWVAEGEAIAYYCPNALDITDALGISILVNESGGPSYTVDWVGGPYTGSTAGDVRVRFVDYQLFSEGSGLRSVCSAVLIIVDGVTAHTLSGFDSSTSRLAPDAIYPFGCSVLMRLGTGADSSLQAPGDGCGAGVTYSLGSVEATLSGGIQFYRNGGLWDFDVVLDSIPIASDVDANGDYVNAPYNLTLSGIVVSDSSWGDHVIAGSESEASLTGSSGSYTATKENQSTNGAVWLFNAEPGGIIRAMSGYELLPIRMAFPSYSSSSSRSWRVPSGGGPGATGASSRTDTLKSALGQLLETAFDSANTLESEIFDTVTSPWEAGSSKGYGSGLVPVMECDPVPVIIQTTEAVECDSWTVGSLSGGLSHASGIPRRWNTWGNPHWSISPWFPPDSASSSVRWDLMGSDSPIAYWYGCRQQHTTHPALDPSDDTRHRPNLVAELVATNPSSAMPGAVTGMPSPWGLSRFLTLDRSAWPTSHLTDETSADRFTFLDGTDPGTGAVTSGSIELTTGDAVEFDMASWTDHPYMAPTLAKEVILGWSATNVSAVKVFAVGADGSKALITDNVEGTFTIPYGTSKKWISTAVMDFGQGEITDDYDPIKGSNGAAAWLASVDRFTSSGLLPAISPVRLRFEITKTNPANPAYLDHIEFTAPDWSSAIVHHLTGGLACILFEDGPMAFYGSLSFLNWATDALLDTPVNLGHEYAPTLGDLWCWTNAFCLGVAAQTDITDYLDASFIEDEEWTLAKHAWRYPGGQQTTFSCIIEGDDGPVFVGTNAYSSGVAPLAMHPDNERTALTNWDDTGSPIQNAYSVSRPAHPHIMPYRTGTDPEPELLLSSSDVLTAGTTVPGWWVGLATEAVDNDEGYDWVWSWDSKDWFGMRTWRGQVFVPGEGGSRKLLAYAVRSDLQNFRGYVSGGAATVETADNALTSWASVGSTVTAEELCLAVQPWGGILLGVIDAGSYKLYRSTGGSFSLSYTVTSTGDPITPCVIAGSDGVIFHYWSDGGTVKGRRYDASGTALGAAYSVSGIPTIDEDGIDGDESFGAGGQRIIRLTVRVGGSLTTYSSTDGETFS